LTYPEVGCCLAAAISLYEGVVEILTNILARILLVSKPDKAPDKQG
jgi:hypothetical protein